MRRSSRKLSIGVQLDQVILREILTAAFQISCFWSAWKFARQS